MHKPFPSNENQFTPARKKILSTLAWVIRIADKEKSYLFMPDISVHICRGQANKIANWFPLYNWEVLCVEENQMHNLWRLPVLISVKEDFLASTSAEDTSGSWRSLFRWSLTNIWIYTFTQRIKQEKSCKLSASKRMRLYRKKAYISYKIKCFKNRN